MQVLPVIMAGGSGTRLWPLSRAAYPKQFIVLEGNRSLFQQAAHRLKGLAAPELELLAPCVVGNEEHRFMLLDQLREIKAMPSSVLLEPAGRNTAPAVTLAALQATADGADPILVVAPADQAVTQEPRLLAALQMAIEEAAAGHILILGIKPTHAETGYGYIRCEAAVGGAMTVAQFVEKPDAARAQQYLDAGTYWWNSGMFVLRASVWLEALRCYRPDILQATQAAWEGRSTDGPFVRPDKPLFQQVPAESVDYAVMERCLGPQAAAMVKMVELDAGWSDLGAWEAVWDVLPKDAQGNATHGDAIVSACSDSLIYATSRLVATVGLEHVVVVETPDAVLVADRRRSQDVKHIVKVLHDTGRSEPALHRQVHRPWGWYDSIDAGARFQVKRIMVKPGASLSLQKHYHRAEHWIVVSGTAEVTRGNQVQVLTENQSTYIPLGEVHRLANPGLVPLEIIEVQSGGYLGEDDIVRLEDTYGRT